ncbi:helix-turn-helix domain-containing protein [Sulfobacillus sp. hq2]|uniref:helix-turn-helix domain-containing protein n=1 Tax=Sulfobacillus TaxID=28033 RepID=UPI0013047DD9|nr:helix-turn-helix domain-containing protein [Sulfobacillus sp. hq2]
MINLPSLSHIQQPVDYALWLHGESSGYVTFGMMENGNNPKAWDTQAVSAIPTVLSKYADNVDIVITLNRFNGPRQSKNLRELNAIWVDLDYHTKPQWQQASPEAVLAEAVKVLNHAQIPLPTFAQTSGNGMWLLWRIDPILPTMLPRWQKVIKRLRQILSPLGADPMATDVARCIRLVGVNNSKNGKRTAVLDSMVIHWAAAWDAALPDAATYYCHTRWDFESLEYAILGRHDSHRTPQATPHRKTPATRRRKPEWLRNYTIETWYQAVVKDILNLIVMRHGEYLPPGERDRYIFPLGVALSHLGEEDIVSAMREFVHSVGGWDEQELTNRLHAVIQTVQKHRAGETMEWKGRTVSPLYRFRNHTLIDWLDITEEEQRQMTTIIGAEERQRRDRERKKQERAKHGKPSRETLAATHRLEVQKLYASGYNKSAIARQVGISRMQVYRLLGPQSVT